MSLGRVCPDCSSRLVIVLYIDVCEIYGLADCLVRATGVPGDCFRYARMAALVVGAVGRDCGYDGCRGSR